MLIQASTFISLRMLMVASIMVLLAACEVPLPGHACTEIGCESSLSISFNAENEAGSIGDYTVVLTRENTEPLTCSFRLSDVGPNCQSRDCIENRECPGLQWAYHEENNERIILVFPQVDGAVGITVSQDDDQLASVTRNPTYVRSQPNGPGCDPICYHATEEIELER